MTLTQRGSSLYKAKLERQIEELRDNGENASDAANHFKNFPTVDSAFGDDFTVLPKFVLTETLEHLNNSGKNTRKSADAVASWQVLRMLSFVHDLQVFASPNSEDDVIYLRALRWASYRKYV